LVCEIDYNVFVTLRNLGIVEHIKSIFLPTRYLGENFDNVGLSWNFLWTYDRRFSQDRQGIPCWNVLFTHVLTSFW